MCHRPVMRIEIATAEHVEAWVEMRTALWPDAALVEHQREIADSLGSPVNERVGLIALTDQHEILGFAEASVRHDPVNGCSTSPVAFLEGIFVTPRHRQCGVARLLLATVEDWGRSKGCNELGSDTDWENVEGRAFHDATGFEKTEQVIFFKKDL